MMSKRRRSAGPAARTTVLDSALVEFKVDYNETKSLADGEAVYSDVVSAGGHEWRIKCHPSTERLTGRKSSLCITVEHVSKSRCDKAIVEAFLLNRYGHPSLTAKKRSWTLCFYDATYSKEWHWFLPLVDPLLENHLVDGQFTVLCTIMVLQDSSIPVPPSDITNHLGALLDSADGTDVSFDVDGETFHAHRAVLAARSPVFRAELLGSMAEATMPCIPLQGIAPATFRAMLRFMYTDSLTVGENELGDILTSSEMIQDLLDAADRYALDWLKHICARKLWDSVSVDTLAVTLACAEIYNIPELKNNCIDFFAKDGNFKKAVLTSGFVQLGLQFPSIVDELRERFGL